MVQSVREGAVSEVVCGTWDVPIVCARWWVQVPRAAFTAVQARGPRWGGIEWTVKRSAIGILSDRVTQQLALKGLNQVGEWVLITTLPPGSDTAPHKFQHTGQQFPVDWQAILSSPLLYRSGGWSPSGPGTNPPHGGQLVSPWTASTSGPSCLLSPLGGAFPFTGLVRLALGTEPSHHAGL